MGRSASVAPCRAAADRVRPPEDIGPRFHKDVRRSPPARTADFRARISQVTSSAAAAYCTGGSALHPRQQLDTQAGANKASGQADAGGTRERQRGVRAQCRRQRLHHDVRAGRSVGGDPQGASHLKSARQWLPPPTTAIRRRGRRGQAERVARMDQARREPRSLTDQDMGNPYSPSKRRPFG